MAHEPPAEASGLIDAVQVKRRGASEATGHGVVFHLLVSEMGQKGCVCEGNALLEGFDGAVLVACYC